MDIRGWPWWREDGGGPEESDISFHFEDIQHGTFDSGLFVADWGDEGLEPLLAKPGSEVPWMGAGLGQVFCSQPVLDPLAIYAALDEFLRGIECPYGPLHYLNCSNGDEFPWSMGELMRFLKITQSASFQICRGSKAICDVVCEALGRQGGKFSFVEDSRDHYKDMIWVRFGDSQFVCHSAYATFK